MTEGRLKLAVGSGLSVWVIEANHGFGDARMHAHHAMQITISLTGELAMFSDAISVRAPAIAIAPDAPHRVEGYGLWALVFVEPEGRFGRALGKRLFAGAPIVGLDARPPPAQAGLLRNAFDTDPGAGDLIAAGRNILDALVPAEADPEIDPRVAGILERVSEDPGGSLDSAARAAGIHLSPSRLRHLFVEQTGLAFKTYVLWLRLQKAIAAYADGRSLTQASHAAGFADQAHFSRTFRRTFGLPASTLERC